MNVGRIYIVRCLTLFLVSITASKSSAQVHQLKTLKIKKTKVVVSHNRDERLKGFSPGMHTNWIDSNWLQQYRQHSLQQLLSQQTPVFIKSYGINSMATLQFRGASSAQSQVLWNGIPLNSANSGITDLSTLGVQQFDQIGIHYGSSAALLGSGNIGGSLLLNNEYFTLDTQKKWQHLPAFELGSFGQLKWSIRERFQHKKLFVSLNLFHQQSKNNFKYQDNLGLQNTMSHAHLRANSALLNIGYALDRKTTIKMALWYQRFQREIPAALFEQYSQKTQLDASLRWSLNIEHQLNKQAKLYNKTAYLKDALGYSDSALLLNTQNISEQIYQELGWRKQLPHQQELLLFAPISLAWTTPQTQSSTKFQNKFALAGAYAIKLMNQRWTIAANGRLETINDIGIALGGINSSFQVFPFMQLRANVQNTFRAPTLNEWYFAPGGNPNLKPEKGWNVDAGYTINLSLSNRAHLKQEINCYNRKINDWIIWFGGSIWTPHNIALVYSRGIETNNAIHFKWNDWNFHVAVNTAFVLATTQKSELPGDGSVGKQIPYTPRYNGQANMGFERKGWRLFYNHTYTGYRFVTTDESAYINPYQLGNITISKDVKLSWNNRISVNAHINNLWNTNYQIVHQRPMPLRNVGVGISAFF